MKKLILWLLPFVLILTACQKSYTFQKDSFYTNIAEHTDLAFPELSFHCIDDLNEDTLYLFFHLMVHTNSLYHKGEDFKKGDHYEIPIAVIKDVLNTYLDTTSFHPSKLSDPSLYNKEKQCIQIQTLPVFGGDRHAVLIKKEFLGNDKVSFTTKIYDNKNQYLYRKTIILRQKEDQKEYSILEMETEE